MQDWFNVKSYDHKRTKTLIWRRVVFLFPAPNSGFAVTQSWYDASFVHRLSTESVELVHDHLHASVIQLAYAL